MTEPALTTPARPGVSGARVVRLASYVFFGVLPVATVLALFAEALREDVVAFDFRVFYDAAEAILRGESPYVDPDDPAANVARSYVYPPLAALGVVPFTVLPAQAAGLLAMALLVAFVLLIPLVLGVRDWRCYGLLLLWPPVLSAVQTGSVTILLGLGAALAWRFRERVGASATAVGASLALKLILWPLAVWLAATRRVVAAAVAVAVAAVLLACSWAVVGFAGLADYDDLLRRLQDVVELDSYTVYVLAQDAGASDPAARALWLLVGLALLVGVVVAGRRGDERTSFVLALAAALALTPIVWLHYFALLAVVVAVAQPRLGPMWFVPLAMLVTPGSGQPTPFETSATLAIAAVVFVLAVRATLVHGRSPAREPEPRTSAA